MLSSLRATVESGAHMEASGVDPNPLDDEDSDLDSRDCQAGQSIKESRTKYVVHASWIILHTSRSQLGNHRLVFVL